MAQNESSSIPQVAACLVIGYLVLRWFFKSDPSASSNPSSSNARPTPVSPADRRRLAQQVEVVRGMFPQFSAAAVEAELLRNGGNIEVTTERILSTGFLPEPPRPTPSPPAATPTPAPRTNRAPVPPAPRGASSSTPKSQYTDLITRYNLHHRLKEERPVPAPTGGKGKAPASKSDRQMAHKAKRDEMVLEARRTVEEAIATGKHAL